MAAKDGFKYRECLTGFKYIGNTAIALENAAHCQVCFGYEEAIGFMFATPIVASKVEYQQDSQSKAYAVRDKDGIAASVIFAEMSIRKIRLSRDSKRICNLYGPGCEVGHLSATSSIL